MPSALQILLGRLLGAILGGLAAWLSSRGIVFTEQNIAEVVSALLTVFGVVYSVVHTIYNSKFNKQGVVSPTLLKPSQDDAKRTEATINHENR